MKKKKNNIDYIRNIGIIAHIDAGKTTLTERILYYTGKSHKLGEVHDGESIMDWMPDEQERGITITSAVTSCIWNNKNIHIIDTPGHVDFSIEVERSLRILDGAVGVFCAVGGVEPQSEAVWKQADKHMIPKIVFINKIDRVGSNFFNTVQSISKKLDSNVLVLQIPVFENDVFSGIIDLLRMKKIEWSKGSFGKTYLVKEIPSNLLSESFKYREKIIENLAENNDEIMDRYLNEIEIPLKLLLKTIRNSTIDSKAVPILCGSALKNRGIQMLLDAIVEFLPSPLDLSPYLGIDGNTGKDVYFSTDDETSLVAFIFKVSIINGRKLSFLRIYSGQLNVGSEVYNSSKNKKERVLRILLMHANRMESIKVAYSGSIVGVIGLKYSSSGETICDVEKKIILEKIDSTKPVISVAIEPKTHSDQEKLNKVLSNFLLEDPTLDVNENFDTGQILLSGMGELHLEIIISRMKKEFNTNVNVGKPQVVHRESITKSSIVRETFDKDIAGSHHYAEVELELFPMERLGYNSFISDYFNDKVSIEFIESLRSGIFDCLSSGVVMGYPVIDVKVVLRDISNVESNSKLLAYKIAASIACKKGLKSSNSQLLDPIMKIDIICPDRFIGEVINDLLSRSGKIKNLEKRRKDQLLKAIIPLEKTFGYSTVLRSLTQGMGVFNISFYKFDFVK